MCTIVSFIRDDPLYRQESRVTALMLWRYIKMDRFEPVNGPDVIERKRGGRSTYLKSNSYMRRSVMSPTRQLGASSLLQKKIHVRTFELISIGKTKRLSKLITFACENTETYSLLHVLNYITFAITFHPI